ncbi:MULTISPECIES: hypothetical protein [unclassified Nocardiopsis]|uniref:hypothetical protein n=1 Tax=unclassified Nocardiopsis TaxID=2649073 RepID=UPI00135A4712|nr:MULTISPECIES: hypothetical protein [unclassified Nocardiopsis]
MTPSDLHSALLAATKNRDSVAVHAALLLIQTMEGDAGFHRAMEGLADQATAHIPKPNDFCCCAITAVATTPDGQVLTQDELPYELRWALDMVTARMNDDQEQIRDLIDTATKQRQLTAAVLALAYLAGRPEDVHSVVL